MEVFLYIIIIVLYVVITIIRAAIDFRRGGAFVLRGILGGVGNPLDARTQERINALREAQIYLSPHSDIWRDLRLSNKYCSLLLGHDGSSITGIEKAYPNRKFKVLGSTLYTSEELWNYFCRYYTYNTHYDGLKELCTTFKVSISESINMNAGTNQPAKSDIRVDVVEKQQQIPMSERLDINNCSELELTALPGISIVLAKKAIKKRDEIGGFKNIDEFFLFMKLKPHMETQLRNMIKVEKMQNKRHKKYNSERSIDL